MNKETIITILKYLVITTLFLSHYVNNHLLHLTVFTSAIYFSYLACKNGRLGWTLIYTAIMVLYSPVPLFKFNQDISMLVNISTSIVIFLSMFIWHLVDWQITVLFGRKEYSKVKKIVNEAIEIAKETFGVTHPNFATSLSNLADIYHFEGKYTEAESAYKEALSIKENALGKNKPGIAINLSNIATLYLKQNKYSEAEPFLKRAMELLEKARIKNQSNFETIINNLALAYYFQAKYTEAEPLFNRLLELWKKDSKKNEFKVAAVLNNIGLSCYFQNRYDEASPLFVYAAELMEKIDDKHPTLAIILSNLAKLNSSQGKYSEAESIYNRALELMEKALGENHPDFATLLSDLGEFYYSQSKYVQAGFYFKRSLLAWDKVAVNKYDHLKVEKILSNIELMSRDENKSSEAESLNKEQFSVSKSVSDYIKIFNLKEEYSNALVTAGTKNKALNDSFLEINASTELTENVVIEEPALNNGFNPDDSFLEINASTELTENVVIEEPALSNELLDKDAVIDSLFDKENPVEPFMWPKKIVPKQSLNTHNQIIEPFIWPRKIKLKHS